METLIGEACLVAVLLHLKMWLIFKYSLPRLDYLENATCSIIHVHRLLPYRKKHCYMRWHIDATNYINNLVCIVTFVKAIE